MKSLKQIMEAKKDDSGYRVTKRVVYDLEAKDDFGRWLRHSSHDSEEKAFKHISKAKAEKTRNLKASQKPGAMGADIGRDRQRRTPHE